MSSKRRAMTSERATCHLIFTHGPGSLGRTGTGALWRNRPERRKGALPPVPNPARRSMVNSPKGRALPLGKAQILADQDPGRA